MYWVQYTGATCGYVQGAFGPILRRQSFSVDAVVLFFLVSLLASVWIFSRRFRSFMTSKALKFLPNGPCRIKSIPNSTR